MNTTLEAIVELAFTTTSRKNLGFDDKFIGTLKDISTQMTINGRFSEPKFFATSYASCVDMAGMLLGVAIPYCHKEVSTCKQIHVSTHGIEELHGLVFMNRQQTSLVGRDGLESL